MLWVGLLSLLAVALVAILGLVFFVVLPQFDLPSGERMVQIPGGTYTIGLGAGDTNHAPEQQLELLVFWLDEFEVTNTDYATFINRTGHEPPKEWENGSIPSGQENHPVAGVTWDLAKEYCESVSKRLPTEEEWEVAARGSTGLSYPWGRNTGDVQLPNDGTYPVGSIAGNESPFLVFDMAGNVWEWVDKPYIAVEDEKRVARGGSYDFQVDMAYRLVGNPDTPQMIATTGIRCAADQVK